MALSNQGFGSGLTQGFEMMDNFYMNEAKKKSYLDDAARADRSMQLKEDTFKITQENQELALKDRKKSELKTAAEKAAFNIKSAFDDGRMANPEDLATMKEFGFDVQGSATPEFTEAVDYFQSGKMRIGTSDFNKYMNILFNGEINRGVGDLITVDAAPETYNRMKVPQSQGVSPNKPERINAKITGKKVLQTYALPNGMMGADLEISYQRDDGSTGTYTAPMTKFRSTVGKGDDDVGHPISSLLDSGFGKIALSTAFAPYRAQINAINEKYGWSPKMSESDKGLANIYMQRAKDASAKATAAMRDSYSQLGDDGANLNSFFESITKSGGNEADLIMKANEAGIQVNEGAITEYLRATREANDYYTKAASIYGKTSEDARQSSDDMIRQRTMPSSQGWGLRDPKQQDEINIAAELSKNSTSNKTVDVPVKKEDEVMTDEVRTELAKLDTNVTSVDANSPNGFLDSVSSLFNSDRNSELGLSTETMSESERLSIFQNPNSTPAEIALARASAGKPKNQAAQLNQDIASVTNIFGGSTDKLGLLKQIAVDNPNIVAQLSSTLDLYRARKNRDKDTEALLFELLNLAKSI